MSSARSSLRSVSVNTPAPSETRGRRSSDAPSTSRWRMLRRRMRSKSPAVTRSSATGIVPTSYCESIRRKSRPKSSCESGMSPRMASHCSSADTISSQS